MFAKDPACAQAQLWKQVSVQVLDEAETRHSDSVFSLEQSHGEVADAQKGCRKLDERGRILALESKKLRRMAERKDEIRQEEDRFVKGTGT